MQIDAKRIREKFNEFDQILGKDTSDVKVAVDDCILLNTNSLALSFFHEGQPKLCKFSSYPFISEEIFNQVAMHEYSHLVNPKKEGEPWHDKNWEDTIIKLGGKPEVKPAISIRDYFLFAGNKTLVCGKCNAVMFLKEVLYIPFVKNHFRCPICGGNNFGD